MRRRTLGFSIKKSLGKFSTKICFREPENISLQARSFQLKWINKKMFIFASILKIFRKWPCRYILMHWCIVRFRNLFIEVRIAISGSPLIYEFERELIWFVLCIIHREFWDIYWNEFSNVIILFIKSSSINMLCIIRANNARIRWSKLNHSQNFEIRAMLPMFAFCTHVNFSGNRSIFVHFE